MSDFSSDSWPDLVLTGRYVGHLRDLGGQRLAAATASAFETLQAAARKDGFALTIASSFRDFERQEQIFSGKWRGVRPVHDDAGRPLDLAAMSDEQKLLAILRFSALPGASRHHWGTDLDLYCARAQGSAPLGLTPQEYGPGGSQHDFALWLRDAAPGFDFFLPYDQDRGGVAVEPWHLSYAPQAVPLLKRLSVGKLADTLNYGQVTGREVIVPRLEELMARFITNVSEP
ncbi:M15 family metallopeptidase [Gallaecimonas xiamenensis]|uniref:Peptidase M15B and M15C, D,D-carboxypeptidase VanY/endolysin n=1 Tax=Gallaecimonas xiamenensis 3-C-1 TaxID=745411 RepID=K2JNX2_9GAMM|nr:M15 family metallopeptidase [Gallaecimonas xiamenensis]EKE76202.1 peptidase M15B and M15C, D,D-carboxypeptidase VanY/endolysin [Gallaecimonas xiamenensis 3-C-1]